MLDFRKGGDLWFDPGVACRDTTVVRKGHLTRWGKKTLRIMIAIVLAANKHGVDRWELLTEDAQLHFLAQADALLQVRTKSQADDDLANLDGLKDGRLAALANLGGLNGPRLK
jgi:hypothetical protein